MKKRYYLLDAIRGFALINMIVFHGIWDMVNIFNYDFKWFDSNYTYIWQQCICFTFILLSGFCYSFGKNKLKRGLIIFLLGWLITLTTWIIMPDDIVLFGVLTLIGSCMLLLIPIEKYMDGLNTYIGLLIFLLLFVLTKNINDGFTGVKGIYVYELPESLYSNLFTAYFGFPNGHFHSSDYFSLLPWLFLFIVGYYTKKVIEEKNLLDKLQTHTCRFLEFMGKHSLLIYVLHQPLVYGMLWLINLLRVN